MILIFNLYNLMILVICEENILFYKQKGGMLVSKQARRGSSINI